MFLWCRDRTIAKKDMAAHIPFFFFFLISFTESSTNKCPGTNCVAIIHTMSLLLKRGESEVPLVLGFSTRMVKGSQASLMSTLIELLGTWGLRLWRGGLSLPILFKPTFNKPF